MPSSIAVLTQLAAVAVRVLLLVALAGIVAFALRRASAAARHVLWSTVLFSVLVLAAASPLPPVWSLPLESLPVPAFEQGTSIPWSQGPSLDGAGAIGAREPGARPRAAASWAGAVLLAWASGTAILALRIVVGVASLHRIAGRGRTIETGPRRALLDTISGSSRRLRRTRLFESDEIRTPATWGVLHPVIAIPATASGWSASNLETAMRHEVAHVRRRDVLTQLLADGCCAMLWFHPAVWYAAGRMRAERERACDDAVLAAGVAHVDYAEMLVAVAAGVSRSVPAAVGMAGALESRVRAILDPAIRRGSSSRVLGPLAAGVLVAAAGLVGLDVSGSTRPAQSADPAFGERLPLTPEREAWALRRRFQPRDEREAQAIERLQDAAQHVKQHEMDFIRDRAVWALAIAREDEVVAPLVRELDSSDWRVRAYAVWCLDVVGAGPAREELTALLTDPVWRVRAMAATALVDLGDAQSPDDVMPLLEDPAWQVRVPAVQLVSRLRTPEAAALIRVRLNDSHPAVRNAAHAVLDETPTP